MGMSLCPGSVSTSTRFGSASGKQDRGAGRRGLVELTALTFGDVTWFQLGELRLFSAGPISDSGRGTAAVILVGDEPGVPLDMRKG